MKQQNTPVHSRIASLDAYRGLMLFIMMLNHLILFPFIHLGSAHDWLQTYVYGPFGILSNSEGFYFLAGIVSGIVYGKILLYKNALDLWPKIKKRILQMYGVHLLLLSAFALLVATSQTYVENWKELHQLIGCWKDQDGIRYFLQHPGFGLLMGSVFLYCPPFFDILPLYMLFLALTPFVLKLLLKKMTPVVLVTSVLLWFIPQYIHEDLIEKTLQMYMPVKLGWFNPLAVQLLFVSGLVMGFFYVKRTLFSIQKIALIAGCGLFFTYGLLHMSHVDLHSCHHLGFLRLITFTLKAFIACFLARYWTIQPLILLGKHSLMMFSYHFACVYALVLVLPQISMATLPLQLVYFGMASLSMWIVAYILEKQREFKSRALEAVV